MEWIERMEHPMPEYPGINSRVRVFPNAASPIALVHSWHRVAAPRQMVVRQMASRNIVSWFARAFRGASRQARDSAESTDANAESAEVMSEQSARSETLSVARSG